MLRSLRLERLVLLLLRQRFTILLPTLMIRLTTCRRVLVIELKLELLVGSKK